MVAYGYGNLNEVPIVCQPFITFTFFLLIIRTLQLYMLQYLTPDILGSFLQLHSSYLIGQWGVVN